jgi:hypothetical protein
VMRGLGPCLTGVGGMRGGRHDRMRPVDTCVYVAICAKDHLLARVANAYRVRKIGVPGVRVLIR